MKGDDRRLLPAAMALTAVAAFPSATSAFELDLSPAAAVTLLAKPVVGNMKAGEVGNLAIFARFCVGGGRLLILFLSRIEDANSPFMHYRATKLESGGLALELLPEPEVGRDVLEQVRELALAERCEAVVATQPDPRLVEIETINGLRRLSELVRQSVTSDGQRSSNAGAAPEAAGPRAD